MVGWEIADGALVALAQDGGHDIVTDDEFENFELVIDWKLSPRANSGIFFNVVEQGNKAIYATGPEYQIIDDDGWPSRLEDWQRTGANYAMHPPLARAAKPVGEWNHTRIVVDRGHVEHWLNGAKTADYQLWTPEWEGSLSRKVEGLSRLRPRQERAGSACRTTATRCGSATSRCGRSDLADEDVAPANLAAVRL